VFSAIPKDDRAVHLVFLGARFLPFFGPHLSFFFFWFDEFFREDTSKEAIPLSPAAGSFPSVVPRSAFPFFIVYLEKSDLRLLGGLRITCAS